jgi:predicted aspartyl protease
MSAFLTAFSGVVRAIVTDVGFVLGTTETSTRVVKSRALWDTGAVTSVIDKSFVEKLGLVPFDTGRAYTAQGFYESSMYLVDVLLPNNIIVKGLRVGDGEFQDFDFLIGMDVISLGDFHLTNDGNTVFKFVIPPESNPNNITAQPSSAPCPNNFKA